MVLLCGLGGATAGGGLVARHRVRRPQGTIHSLSPTPFFSLPHTLFLSPTHSFSLSHTLSLPLFVMHTHTHKSSHAIDLPEEAQAVSVYASRPASAGYHPIVVFDCLDRAIFPRKRRFRRYGIETGVRRVCLRPACKRRGNDSQNLTDFGKEHG